MRIRFANWQPDLQGLTNPGQDDIKNVVPTGGGGYAPIKDIAALSTTGLDSMALGAISAQDASGTTQTFAGDAAKLYKLTAAVFSDVSLAGGYTVAGDERWSFTQWGQRVLATQIGNVVQYFDLGLSSAFANLAGSPPQARYSTVIRDFVFLANTTTSPSQTVWSGFNDSEGWAAGVNQSDAQTLQTGGWIQGITGGEVGTIFQEHAVTRVTYVGPAPIFQFDTIDDAPGLAAPGSLIKVQDQHFYYSQDGFYTYSNASGAFESIGNSKVDRWFNDHIEPGTFAAITGGADPANKLVFWSFVSTDVTSTSHPDTLLIYNWATKEFSYAKVNHDMLFSALTEGVTLEQLGASYPILENVPASFDSRVWTGGASYLAAFDTNHQIGSFSGLNLAALMETSDQEPIPGRRAMVTKITPLCDTSSATAIVRSRERFADAMTDSASNMMETSGDIPCLSSGRWHRAQLSIPAGSTWTYATGLDLEAMDDGAQ